MKMRRIWIAFACVGAMALVAGSALLAAGGDGPIGPGPCTCEGEPVDADEDGICDVCGGCIPDGDGPKGPQGPKGPKS